MTFQSGDRIFIEGRKYCLFLIDITFRTPEGDAGLEYVFPNITGRIKAIWYSGELRIPLGGPVKLKDDSYLSWYILT